jgi:hypothetical protein
MAELISSNYSKATFPELLTFRFGMSKAEAKNLYKKGGQKPIFERYDRLDFISPPVDIPNAAETNLIFKKEKLIEVSQYFSVSGDDSSAFKHISKYRDLKDQLTAKYGPPESIEFMDDNYNNSELRLEGFKTKKGNYASIWRNVKGMDIFLVLGGDNLDIFLRLTYKQKSKS